MLQQLSSCLSGLGTLDVVVADDCVAADDGPCPCLCLLHSALCCPDDSLDDGTFVFEFIEDDHELLRDLAVAASLPPPTAAAGRGNENDDGVESGSVAGHGGQSQTTAAGHVVVPCTRKRDRSSVSVTRGTWSWSSSLLDMATASVPTRRRTPNNNSRRGSNNGVRRQQQQCLVSRRPRGPPRSTRRRVHRRACTHCGSTETPHWRAGPDGPATLCNACGIRYTREQSKLLPPPPPPPPPPEHLPAAVVGEPEQEGVVRPREKKAKKIR